MAAPRRYRLCANTVTVLPAVLSKLGERIEMPHVRIVEQLAEIGAGEHAVAHEGSDLRGDEIALLRDRLLGRGKRERESHGELGNAWITRSLDRALDERELFGTATL